MLRGAASRVARFETAFLFHDGAGAHAFGGACEGAIARTERGSGGFGFDPIFIPAGSRRTIGEMSLQEKNRVSHRARAALALAKHVAGGTRRAPRGRGRA